MYCAVTNCVSTSKVNLSRKKSSWSINNTKVTLLVSFACFKNFFHEKCKLFARYKTAVYFAGIFNRRYAH